MTRRVAELIVLLAASWCVMTFTHEAGHLVGGWLSGATLVAADLRPWRLPYSLHRPDPSPLVTLWAGPMLGVAVPLLAGAVTRHRWAWFAADFCLLANGVYLALGWLSGDRYLDTPRLFAEGASAWLVAAYCAATITIGYAGFRRDCVRVFAQEPPAATSRRTPAE